MGMEKEIEAILEKDDVKKTLSDVINSLDNLKRLLDDSYSYSIVQIQRCFFDTMSSKATVREEISELVKGQAKATDYRSDLGALYKDLVYRYQELIKIFLEAECTLKRSHGRIIFSEIYHLTRDIQGKVIIPFVNFVRTAKNIRSQEFDAYNSFKDKWNSILNDIERLASDLGISIDFSGHKAPELGVALSP